MGRSTDALLVYGYHLGSVGDGLEVHEARQSETNPYGYLKLPWYDAEHEDLGNDEDEDEDDDLIEAMVRRLYDSIPDAAPVKYSWDRSDVVKDRLGVWFETHCSGDYPMHILTTALHRASRGDADVLDLAALAARPAADGWDAKLAHALTVLQITPNQERPAWLLASYWG